MDGSIFIEDTVKKSSQSKKYCIYVDSIERVKKNLIKKKEGLEINKAKYESYISNDNLEILRDPLTGALLFFSIISYSVAASGFSQWHRHSQKYLDIILMREAKISEEQILKYIEKDDKKITWKSVLFWKNK